MRRWTLLIVSHDSDAPRSISVSERAIRLAGGLIVLVLLVTMVGVGTIAARLGRLGAPAAAPAPVSVAPPVDPVADSLEVRVGALRSVIDSLERLDLALASATGSQPADSVVLTWVRGPLPNFLKAPATRPGAASAGTADTLLQHALSLRAKLRALDSVARARERTNVSDSR